MRLWFLVLILALVLAPASVLAQNETNATTTEPDEGGYWDEWNGYLDEQALRHAGSRIWQGLVLFSSGIRDALVVFADAAYYFATGQRLSPETRGLAATVLGFLALYWFLKSKLGWVLSAGRLAFMGIALYLFFNLSNLPVF